MREKLCSVVLASIFIAVLLSGGPVFAWHDPPQVRSIDPIVSTGWLADNSQDVVIVDIRSNADYDAGHIPGAINEPFVFPESAWITIRDGLLLEVPDDEDLFATLGSLGITPGSYIVVVTAPNPQDPAPFYGLANGTRVAATLIYAGVPNVAILDGGYDKWVADGYETTTEISAATPVTYEGDVNKRMFVSVDYVRRHLWKADIIDARDADVYFGVTVEPFADKAGHIPGASSLPAPWIWDSIGDGIYTFKDTDLLGEMAAGVLGDHRYRRGRRAPKTIVYCGVGGYASSWWFVLTQVLGCPNVRFYDGAAQEWVLYYDMVPFQWE